MFERGFSSEKHWRLLQRTRILFQHLHGCSQPCVTPVLENLKLSSGPSLWFTHRVHIHACRQNTYPNKIKINLTKSLEKTRNMCIIRPQLMSNYLGQINTYWSQEKCVPGTQKKCSRGAQMRSTNKATQQSWDLEIIQQAWQDVRYLGISYQLHGAEENLMLEPRKIIIAIGSLEECKQS